MLMVLTDICWCLLKSTLDYIIRIHLAKFQGQMSAYRNVFFFFSFFPSHSCFTCMWLITQKKVQQSASTL